MITTFIALVFRPLKNPFFQAFHEASKAHSHVFQKVGKWRHPEMVSSMRSVSCTSLQAHVQFTWIK